MRYRLPAAAFILLLGGALVWVLISRHSEPVAARPVAEGAAMEEVPQVVDPPASETSGAIADAATANDSPDATGAVPAAPKRPALAAAAEPPRGPEPAPGLTPVVLLENMRSTIQQYSARFGGNPVGNNQEITAALNGDNPTQVVFLNPEDGLRINDRGELIDNWGTPFFFHQLSRTEMEIHSAGPDRRMWTRDDLVIK